MKITALLHASFEGLGAIAEWAVRRAAAVDVVRLYADQLPKEVGCDLLVVMGGPMSVGDEREHPWLVPEKRFIEGCLAKGTPTLGVCLGAQLLADVLGAAVRPNGAKEIGWFPIEPVQTDVVSAADPRRAIAELTWTPLNVFHWHGDTFEIPDGALHLERSSACARQSFLWGERVLGLQYHLEMTREGIAAIAAAGAAELEPSPSVQPAGSLSGTVDDNDNAHRRLACFLDILSRV